MAEQRPKNEDPRGVLRGRCKGCSCDGYERPASGFKCDNCGHPPGKHDSSVSGSSQQAQSSPSPSSQTTETFSIGPLCAFSGCKEEPYFDMNTLTQSLYCKDHLDTVGPPPNATLLPQQFQDGINITSPPDSSLASLSSPSLDVQQSPHKVTPSQNPPQTMPMLHQTMPSQSPQHQAMLPQFQHHTMPPFYSAPILASTSSPALAMQRTPPPPVPAVAPALQCKLPGCKREKYKEKDGKLHDFCGRGHALQFSRLNQQEVVPQDQKCKTPGCNLRRRAMDDGQGFYDYCSLKCRNSGAHSAQAAALHPSHSMQGLGTCLLPGCSRPKYVDPANNRTHDYCGRTHAAEAQRKGIPAGGGMECRIERSTGTQLSTVTATFKLTWAKGSCPPITCVFVVKNSMLEQRFQSYRQKLSNQAVEKHFHGTKLTCAITAQSTLCIDSNCGICGISKNGLDRRCIRKNINFQRYGHGFYLAPNSSKCHDYTQGSGGYRAMILFDVAPGVKYQLQRNDETLQSPPKGYDSIHGVGGRDSVLNYDELVVYNPDSVMPRYIIVYQKAGTDKIAK